MSKPLHPKAREFQRERFFAGIKTFATLEARITALPDEKARGDAFEVFAEAYLATQRKHDATEILPLPGVSLALLVELGLSANDQGVDGIFKTVLRQFNAYQVKFRSNRQPLTWRELSTFMGLADSARIRSRVLLTNCDDLPAVMNDRKGFFCIRGSDLDRLDESDFQAIEQWLAHAVVQRTPKQPRPHQQEALDVLLPALREQDRVTAIMACGTGKTLVALWLAEHVARASSPASSGGVPAARILVLLPSLALLRQTLHEWLHETSLPSLSYLCVCSDPSVKDDLDAIATPQSDLDFPVTTDRRSVREFLDAPFVGVKVIFSTYQSAHVVGEAMRKGESFDLGIFDEAHKTAGRDGRNYAFALEDSNLPIRKRFFLTATPRHYNPQRRDKEGDAQLVFSMDKPAVYGPQAFRLTFSEAARRGIICNYKVIISVITSAQVTNELLSRGETLVNGDLVRARQVANQIALQDAIAKYGVNKVFTFHRTVQSAASFVSEGNEGIGTHLAPVTADVRRLTSKRFQRLTAKSQAISQSLLTSAATSRFQTFHVNGTMPTARRERLMRDFRAAPRAVMSNARCLTEGVDVPAVDMVAFLSPRRSRVDIVQATSRAMRLAPGKTTGYVLVPLYLEQAAGETVEQAVSRSDFDEVWEVLQSLQEQDEVLAEIIREIREERGRTKGFDDSRFRERVEVIGPSMSLTALEQAICTACVDLLGDTWDERYGELKLFQNRFAHCNVPAIWTENPQLGRWVVSQRVARKKSSLRAERVAQLDEIGFIWDIGTAAWEEMFCALSDFRRTHGQCNVPDKWGENLRLSAWVGTQRQVAKQGKLLPVRAQRLNELGFVWDTDDANWDEMFKALSAYKQVHGDCLVPQAWRDNPRLGTWVGTQRRLQTLSKLRKDRFQRLDEIQFVWDSVAAVMWEEKFKALVRYKTEHGDCNVPRTSPEYRSLSLWGGTQRQLRRKGRLPKERVQRLDAIGFKWATPTVRWGDMFHALEDFQRKHGHCDVPQDWPPNLQLRKWVQNQKYKRDLLSKEACEKLEALGFVWYASRDYWEDMFRCLARFKEQNGHCNVPSNCREDPKLATWVEVQRRHKRKGTLNDARLRRLEELGFVWAPTDEFWESMYSAMRKYQKEHGDCNVRKEWRENPQLGAWVCTQRRLKRENRLNEDRVWRLEQLGFVWDLVDTFTERMFDALVEFKRNHGHCNVPNRYSENLQLGNWVNNQRRLKKTGSLGASQAERLEQIGFVWGSHDSAWERMFSALSKYRDKHGDCNVPRGWQSFPRLAMWLTQQRFFKRAGKLAGDRIARLERLGIVWEPAEQFWEKMFSELQVFWREHGHCNVPDKCNGNLRLSTWVGAQRRLSKKGELDPKRIQQLNRLGFVWSPIDAHWENMLDALAQYRLAHGDCNVPHLWKANPKLGIWVNNQRRRLKAGKLSDERMRRLRKLGFRW